MRPSLHRPQLRPSRLVSRAEAAAPRPRGALQRHAVPAIAAARPPAIGATAAFAPGPYVDYARRLTPQGGIAITYKDHDRRFRHTLRRLLMWSYASGLEGWFLLYHSPLYHLWAAVACWVLVAIVNWKIVAAPVETYRTVEIRPDCMIIDGADVFWVRHMEGRRPSIQPDRTGRQVLCGIYGTRFVEYLIVRRCDKLDRMPDVFDAHLRHAMQQLWTGLH